MNKIITDVVDCKVPRAEDLPGTLWRCVDSDSKELGLCICMVINVDPSAIHPRESKMGLFYLSTGLARVYPVHARDLRMTLRNKNLFSRHCEPVRLEPKDDLGQEDPTR